MTNREKTAVQVEFAVSPLPELHVEFKSQRPSRYRHTVSSQGFELGFTAQYASLGPTQRWHAREALLQCIRTHNVGQKPNLPLNFETKIGVPLDVLDAVFRKLPC